MKRKDQTHGVVSDTPRGDTNAVADVEARVLGLDVVGGSSAGNVELGDGALGRSGAECLHGILDVVGARPAAAVGKVLGCVSAVESSKGLKIFVLPSGCQCRQWARRRHATS